MQQILCKRLLLALGLLAGLGALSVVLAQTNSSLSEEAVESLLLAEPKTPQEFFETTVLMIDLARPKLARRYLDKLMESKPDDALLLKIRSKHGPGVFLRLANVGELKPVSSQLLDQMNRAFRRHGADPKEIDKLIAALSASPQERQNALISLRDSGPIIIPRFLQNLGMTDQPEQRDLLVNTLSQLGSHVVAPLVGALDSPNEALRISVIDSLGWLGSRDAVPHLWYPAFGKNQPPGVQLAARRALARILDTSEASVNRTSTSGVAEELRKTAVLHFRREYPWKLDEEDNKSVSIWTWNSQTQTVDLSKHSPDAASVYVGTRLAGQSLELAPDNQQLQALVAAMSLASAMHHSGAEKSLVTGPGTAHDLALTAGADVISRALSLSLENTNADAAISTLQILGQIATKNQIYKTASRQSPITAALNYPDLQVQFAAAQTILQLDPDRSFRDSIRVVSILTRVLNDSGSPRAVVAHGNTARASNAAAFLNEVGYDAIPVSTGRDAFRVASGRGDVELVLLNVNTARWELSQTIANLRADARTAAIPIAIFGPQETEDRVQSLIRKFPAVIFLEDFTNSDFLEIQIRPFLHTMMSSPLSGPQRAQRKAAAAYWISHIADGRRTDIFDLRASENVLVGLLSDPKLASHALTGLGAIPTIGSQRQLQATAVSNVFDIKTRQGAALQLAFHIQRFGLLLSKKEVSEIEHTWRTSEDPNLATALASVIGSLKPNSTRVSGLLRTLPAPTASAN
ncbi:MAG: HEAT repeat domain-containing protein [Planctomycetes bacterium]|nr:HEAT repeat domain-containing protein [Planctomycetota bacterium]